MADAMVTARMGAGKKTAASKVLESLGISANAAVNALFDYLIANGKMPDLSNESDGVNVPFETSIAEAREWIKSIDGVAIIDNASGKGGQA